MTKDLNEPYTISSQGDGICYYCHKNGHLRNTCWDLYGWPSDGRDRTSRCDGRRGGLGNTQRAYASDKALDDETSVSEPTVEDMIARLTSHMTALQARIFGSSSGVEGYHSLSPFLSSLVIKSVNVLRGLATKIGVDKTWIVDSGVSQHMTPDSTVFKSYKPLSGKEKVQTADDTFCSIVGIGNITCTSNIHLSSVLHVPNFTNNLMSVSQLIDDLNCIVSLSPSNVVVHELKTGKMIGIGKRNEDLYRLE
jgi:hypothetical protein